MTRQIHITNFKSYLKRQHRKVWKIEFLAICSNSCKHRSNARKVELDQYDVNTNSYTKFQVKMSKYDRKTEAWQTDRLIDRLTASKVRVLRQAGRGLKTSYKYTISFSLYLRFLYPISFNMIVIEDTAKGLKPMDITIWWQIKLEWGCPNETKYPPRQPTPNRAILPNRARLQTDRRTDGRTDRVIPVYPP